MRSYLPIVVLGLSSLHCTGALTPPDTGAEAGPRCDDRKGGAVVQILVKDQAFRLWSHSAAFIARANELKASGKTATAMFGKLIDGSDCDTRWTFHVDESDMSWPDVAMEVCDGRPSDIEGNKPYWLNNVKRWCPWNTKVVAVEERP